MSTNKSEGQSRSSVHQDSHGSIIKSTSKLSLGTLSSRILGFIRDVVLARLLGTGFGADAFFVAFKIPNLFRDLVGEGATNSAVVPVLSEHLIKQQRKEFWSFVNVVFTLAFIVLSAITLMGMLLSPVLVRMIAPGFIAHSEKLHLTIQLTKLLFPYLIFIGLTAYSMGVLFTFRSFTVPAFSPCLLNISIIISALISAHRLEEPVYGLAIGVLIGGILQLLVQFKALRKIGFKIQIPKSLFHPGAQKIGRLLIPRMLGSGVYQMTVLIDTFCASLSMFVGAGGISAIYYANRIIQFPMGVFGVALASAVLPSLSGLVHKQDVAAIKKIIVFSLENIFFVMCPITVVLLLLSNPIIRILFQRGEFNLYSTQITSWALSFYAIGLFSFGGIKILVTAFHAFQDTKTPVKVAFLCLMINAILNFVLMKPLKVGGIALASSIAGTLDFLILFVIMDKRLGGLNSGLLVYLSKVILISGITGLVLFWSWNHLLMDNEVIKLGLIGLFGGVFYETLCLAVKIPQAKKVYDWVRGGFKF